MAKQALEGKRRTSFLLDPESLTLVYDESHPLYDERVHWPIDESIVLSIMDMGVQVAIKVRKNGQLVEVADGRGRVKNCLEANRRLKKKGKELVRIPCEVERGSDAFLASLGIALNELRRQDDPLTRAKKMQRLLGMGRTHPEVGVAFGLGVSAVKLNLALLDLSSKVQASVASGELGPTSAVKVYSKLTREQQDGLLDKERAAGTLGVAVTGKPKRRRKKAGSGAGHSAPSRKHVLAVSKHPTLTDDERNLLAWAAGEAKLAGLPKKLRDIVKES